MVCYRLQYPGGEVGCAEFQQCCCRSHTQDKKRQEAGKAESRESSLEL